MKTFTGSLIALLFSLTGFAQDWAPYVPGQVSYYKEGPYHILRKIDTQIIRSKYTVQYFQHYGTTCKWDSTKIVRPLDSLVIRGDTFSYFYPATVSGYEGYPEIIPDSLNFFFGKHEGFTWQLIVHSHMNYPDADTLEVTIDSVYVGNFLGITDSLKRIKFSSFNFGNTRVVLSKKHGLIQGILPVPRSEGIDFDYFPSQLISDNYQLIGLQNDSLTVGFQFPDVEEFFKLSPGDIIKWKHTYSWYFDQFNYGMEHTYSIDSIVSASISPNEFRYSWKRRKVVNATPNDSIEVTYDSTIVSLELWRGRLASNSLHISTLEPFQQDRIYVYSDYAYNKFGLPEFKVRTLEDYQDSCLTDPHVLGLSTDNYYRVVTATKGIGLTRFSNGHIDYDYEISAEYFTDMVGYKNVQGVYGDISPLQLGKSDLSLSIQFSIYPNPASSTIKLDLPSRVLQQGQLTIQDILGRILIHRSLNGNPAVLVDQLQSGLYLISVIAEDQRYQAKLLIQ